MPNLHDITEKFKGISVETQACGNIDNQTKCVQTYGP